MSHEISAYQEELTVQNEELIRAQHELEQTRDRFVELFEFAPNGYVIMNEHGVVRQINLTGASLLGKPRRLIEGLPLLGSVVASETPTLLQFLLDCRRQRVNSPDVSGEFRFRFGNTERTLQLISKRAPGSDAAPDYLVAMIDVSEARRLAAERHQAAAEHIALARRLLTVRDEERRRISRDLHDIVGQQVTSLRLMLELVGMGTLDESSRARLSRVQDLVTELDRQLDFIIKELRPSSLDFGLAPAIEQFVREWSTAFEIEAHVSADDVSGLNLGAEAETHFYRMVQEALNNVNKHAHATIVTVRLARRRGFLDLVVEDNGRGLNAAGGDGANHQGLGLVGMRERAQILGGTLTVASAPSTGTIISVRVPLDASSPPPDEN